jgi:hypothetical protein
MLHTGYKIALEVNKVSETGGLYNVRLEIKEELFFLYSDPCVWSNVLGIDNCIGLLKREVGMHYNSIFKRNFWDNNKELIFSSGKLTILLAEMFNVPIEEIGEDFPRTPELVQSVAQR